VSDNLPLSAISFGLLQFFLYRKTIIECTHKRPGRKQQESSRNERYAKLEVMFVSARLRDLERGQKLSLSFHTAQTLRASRQILHDSSSSSPLFFCFSPLAPPRASVCLSFNDAIKKCLSALFTRKLSFPVSYHLHFVGTRSLKSRAQQQICHARKYRPD
jgi:hypothetical protein